MAQVRIGCATCGMRFSKAWRSQASGEYWLGQWKALHLCFQVFFHVLPKFFPVSYLYSLIKGSLISLKTSELRTIVMASCLPSWRPHHHLSHHVNHIIIKWLRSVINREHVLNPTTMRARFGLIVRKICRVHWQRYDMGYAIWCSSVPRPFESESDFRLSLWTNLKTSWLMTKEGYRDVSRPGQILGGFKLGILTSKQGSKLAHARALHQRPKAAPVLFVQNCEVFYQEAAERVPASRSRNTIRFRVFHRLASVASVASVARTFRWYILKVNAYLGTLVPKKRYSRTRIYKVMDQK